MRTHLAILQFPFLYCVGVLAGLSAYVRDFGSVSCYLCVIPLLVVPAVLPRLGPVPLSWLRSRSRMMAAAGVLLGALAYRPLHLGFWDEMSLAQAVAISAFGLVSAAVAWLAVTQPAGRDGQTSTSLAGAICIVALFFFLSQWYPLIPILGAALCLAPVVTLRWKQEEAAAVRGTQRMLFLSALAFYLAAEVGQVVWDLGIDPSWGPQLSVVFLAAAIAAVVWSLAGKRFANAALQRPSFAAGAGLAGLLLAGATSVATAWHPAFLLSPIRQLLFGLVLGGMIVAVHDRTSRSAGAAATWQKVWLWFTIGLAIPNLYGAHLEAFPAWRLAYASPAIVAFVWEHARAVRGQTRK